MGNCVVPQNAVSWADGDEWASESIAGPGGEGRRPGMGGGVEVKIRISRRQLRELMEKSAGGGKGDKNVLAGIINSGVVVNRRRQHREVHWRPALQSISEAVDS